MPPRRVLGILGMPICTTRVIVRVMRRARSARMAASLHQEKEAGPVNRSGSAAIQESSLRHCPPRWDVLKLSVSRSKRNRSITMH